MPLSQFFLPEEKKEEGKRKEKKKKERKKEETLEPGDSPNVTSLRKALGT